MGDETMSDQSNEPPASLLPYESWMEDAQRQVVMRAIAHAAEHGLPGDHHFYVTFRTDFPGVQVPARISSQYPEEMTVVLQHQFWDLKADSEHFTVGLSFSGIPTTLVVPAGAIVGFADPHVHFGLRLDVGTPQEAAAAPADVPEAVEEKPPTELPQIVSLDAFRRRPVPKD
jgi:hypothetical protein